MAELITADPTTTSSCCSTEAQTTCCEPSEKADCCATEATAAGGCGCSAGQATDTADASTDVDIRETVRAKYAAAARAVAEQGSGSCCGPISLTDADQTEVFGGSLYEGADTEGATATAVAASLGCGVPTAVADLHEGETVLDLGSGAGADVLISARRVGATGRAIGLDMTDEMLDLARANAAEAGVENVEFVKGYIEDIPLADGSVDVIVSNCVLNLSGDKPRVLAEAARVLRPGGRFAVSDVIAGADMDEATRADLAAYTGCIAGALTEQEFREGLAAAGLVDVEIRETHRVHEHAVSAIIRARKPSADTPAMGDHVGSMASAGTRQFVLYEPAMCCQTGVCGPSVDPQLIDVREHLRWAEGQGATVTRHNLSSDPDAFVANSKVTGLMAAFGDAALPALVVDGEIAVHGRYPSRDELAGLLDTQVPAPLELSVSADSCGCEPGGCC
ncbi:MAG: arsenite efflux transporter metallochaperone ArsD [Solirubrobacteraceae bacterium]|jgi:SAM-dependent methyltransferase